MRIDDSAMAVTWLPCAFRGAEAESGNPGTRFGHSTAFISGSVWGTDFIVLFGGVAFSDGLPGDAALDQHAALSDVQVCCAARLTQDMAAIAAAAQEAALL